MSSELLTKEAICESMVKILGEMTADWETEFDGGITEDTKLISDLGFESIDVVQLIVAIEEQFQRRDMPFEELLMRDGRYVDEISVRDTVDFLHRHLGNAGR